MEKYHKIPTVFKRNPNSPRNLIEGKYSLPEFDYLKDNIWTWREKIDGTNIRIQWRPMDSESPDTLSHQHRISIKGKSDNSQMPIFLLEELQKMFTFNNMLKVFPDNDVCLYGEGYGAKIQKGGGNYISKGNSFLLFDIRIGPWWLEQDVINDLADKLGIQVAPIVGEGTLSEGIEYVRKGFNSFCSETPQIAEGLIMVPKINLLARNARRIITKIKYKDFK